jgi:prepilin-type N-terminal cleavage/methylation domain-containing protein
MAYSLGSEAAAGVARPRQAFTLIEVLVVVAIIALLVAILIPSLASARDLARTTVCKTHLDQLYKGHNFYAHDNKNHFPNVEWWLWDGAAWSMSTYFPSTYNKTGGARPADSSRWVEFGQIYRYVKDKEVYFCPNDTKNRQNHSIGAGGVYGNKPIHSYVRLVHPHEFVAEHSFGGLNAYKSVWSPANYINPDELPKSWTLFKHVMDPRPSRLAFMYEEFQNFGDNAQWNAPNSDDTLNDGYSGFIRGWSNYSEKWEDYIAAWHKGRKFSHLAYFDGHIELVDAVRFNREPATFGLWKAAGGPKP